MKTGFYMLPAPLKDPSPKSDPAAIPIRIVADPLSPVPSDANADADRSSSKSQDKSRNDLFYPAWDKFLALEPKRGKKLSTIVARTEEENIVLKDSPEGIFVRENAVTSYQDAAQTCRERVAAIVKECRRLNQKYRDASFDLEGGLDCVMSLGGQTPGAFDDAPPPWVRRVPDIFEKPQFFLDGAGVDDIHQGAGGDCWFLAALMAVASKKGLIEKLCVARDEQAGVYGFVFYRDGEWISEVIDDKLYMKVGDDDSLDIVRSWNRKAKEGSSIYYEDEKLKAILQKGPQALYFSNCGSEETWVPLIEKAFAKCHGDYASVEGGWASEGCEDLTGGVSSILETESIMDKDKFFREQLLNVNNEFLFGAGSIPTSYNKNLVSGHAYAVLEAFEDVDKGLKLVKLKNPWGEFEWSGDWSDGSKFWTPELMIKLGHTFGDDGTFWMSYKDFLRHFPALSRVRLFDESWQVAQQWTTMSVPWTVDYLDDEFRFSVSESGPVVVVLQQPDERYWAALQGRYLYSLHFRVYRNEQGGEDYLVRSLLNSGFSRLQTRSVSAEMEDVKPGTYRVVVKVTAVRMDVPTGEEMIMKYAQERKEKLLQTGRRFDYAATKGNLRQYEKTKRRETKQQLRQQTKDDLKLIRKRLRKAKEQNQKKKQRIREAMKAIKEKRDAESTERKKSKPQEQATQASQARKDEQAEGANFEASQETQGKSEVVSKNTGPDLASEASQSKPDDKPTEEEKVKPGQGNDDQGPRRADEAVDQVPGEDADSIEDSDDLDDEDFEWNSEIDDPLDDYEDDEVETVPGAGSRENDIFAADPWDARCVLGLRVYCKTTAAKVWVVKEGVDIA